MRIDHLRIHNFKGFEDKSFDFPRSLDSSTPGSFHVLIGENGSGKSSALDALAVALGIWHVASPSAGWRSIEPEEARLLRVQEGDQVRFDPSSSPSISVQGSIDGLSLRWTRENKDYSSKTVNTGAKDALDAIKSLLDRALNEKGVSLPVVAYYGAGRAWLAGRDRKATMDIDLKKTSRFDAYYHSLDGQIRHQAINRWFLFETVENFQRGEKRTSTLAVEEAVLSCVPGATRLRFDGDRKEIVLAIGESEVPFYSLSDGQRSMVSMVADIAIKAVTLNPHLGENAAKESAGVVMIDELDLHLHPKWQREVVEHLRNAFPCIQFVGTTHSPFIVQTLREGELISLDAQTIPETGNVGIETIAKGLMGVHRPDVSPRYANMKAVAKDYLLKLEGSEMTPDERLKDFERELAKDIEPYADNPAFQAFLELKREGKLGRRKNETAESELPIATPPFNLPDIYGIPDFMEEADAFGLPDPNEGKKPFGGTDSPGGML
jgi:predicted ATP-binding protein involved in virulence